MFRRLGINAYLAWRYLLHSHGSTIKDISETRHLVYNSVQSSLKKLVRHNLAFFSTTEGVYVARNPEYDEMAEIARELGTEMNAKNRDRKFKIERELNTNRKIANAIQHITNKLKQQ